MEGGETEWALSPTNLNVTFNQAQDFNTSTGLVEGMFMNYARTRRKHVRVGSWGGEGRGHGDWKHMDGGSVTTGTGSEGRRWGLPGLGKQSET